jgi:hypothetical protein
VYQGDFNAASLVVFNFNTASFTDGSPITFGGTPALSVYKNSTTESTAGVTLTVDYDSRTGMQHVAIDTSADGTFYAAGNDFDVIITTGTVGGTSVVGRKVGSFSLANRSALRPATAGRTLVVDAAGLADANAVKMGPSGSGTALTARDVGASVLLSPGTGTGQVSLSSGTVTVGTNNDKTGYSLTQTFPTNFSSLAIDSSGRTNAFMVGILTSTFTETTTGFVAAGFKQFFNVSSPTGTINSLPNHGPGGPLGLVTIDNTGNLNSYQIGSVFGDVGGNVDGSVASVTDPVSITGDLSTTMKTSLNTAIDARLEAFDPPTNAEMVARTLVAASYGTSTLTQTQVTGGAYALNSSSFSFDATLDLTSTQKTSVQTAAAAAVDSEIPFNGGHTAIIATLAGADGTAINVTALAQAMILRTGTCQSGSTSSTIKLDSGASATTDFYKGRWIVTTGGTGAEQVALCTAYNGSTKVATIAPNWAATPDGTTTFSVNATAPVDVGLWRESAPASLDGSGNVPAAVETMTNVALQQFFTAGGLGAGGDTVDGSVLDILCGAMIVHNTGFTYADATGGAPVYEIVHNVPSSATIAAAVRDVSNASPAGGSLGAAVNSRLAASAYTAPPTAAQNATAVWTDTTSSDFTVSGSPGKIVVTQLGSAFTTTSSSVFTIASLANGPSGGGGGSSASATWAYNIDGTPAYNLLAWAAAMAAGPRTYALNPDGTYTVTVGPPFPGGTAQFVGVASPATLNRTISSQTGATPG